MDRVDEIRDRERKATRGKWHWWTSNSWRRLIAEEVQHVDSLGHVLMPFNNRADGHIDIAVSESDMALIENAPEDLRYLLRLAGEYEKLLLGYDVNAGIAAARERAK